MLCFRYTYNKRHIAFITQIHLSDILLQAVLRFRPDKTCTEYAMKRPNKYPEKNNNITITGSKHTLFPNCYESYTYTYIHTSAMFHKLSPLLLICTYQQLPKNNCDDDDTLV